MKKAAAKALRAFLIELVVYAALVTGYFFAVLIFLGAWLSQLSQHHRVIYAGTALALIIGQAVLLESLTTFLLRLFGGRSE